MKRGIFIDLAAIPEHGVDNDNNSSTSSGGGGGSSREIKQCTMPVS